MLQLIEGEYRELGGAQRTVWAGLAQRAWQERQTRWHDTEHRESSLGFGKRSDCYWKDAVVARTLKGGKGLHTLRIQLSYGHITNGALHRHCSH
jgi:hypothetical protein